MIGRLGARNRWRDNHPDNHPDSHLSAQVILLLVVIGVTLIAIGTLMVASLRPISSSTTSAAPGPDSGTPTPVGVDHTTTTRPTPSAATGPADTTELQQRLTALESGLVALTSRVDQLANQPATTSIPVTVSSFKKQTIFLGSDKTTNRDWTNTGVEITLSSGDFYAGAPVVFEASLSIEGGEAHARLVNSTTGGILTQTELGHNRGSAVWKTAPAFPLPTGSNKMTVQLRSTSGERAFLEGARLVIGS
ncbi:MAG: hypothetical protein COU69_02055 [Candidatus Pacebacteria bacterium CG10_big_fil_rev_8_21_14_0_10_56_10]|nr:MAG: hypothetical protein COU69_02055 [Candidatus Pacebacteria bacterium CG10_big_fil_rev_8_21_14_0_10_56_10]